MKPQNASATAKSTTLRDQFLKRLPYEIYHYRPHPYPISCGLLLLTHKIPPADTSCCEACGGYRHLRYNQVARRCNFRLEILYPCTKGGSIDNREVVCLRPQRDRHRWECAVSPRNRAAPSKDVGVALYLYFAGNAMEKSKGAGYRVHLRSREDRVISRSIISILRQSRRYYDCWPLKGA
jgi:hypothetical protein